MTNPADPSDFGARLLDELTTLVSCAAGAVMRVRAAGPAARYKADRTPVTDADEAAEAVLLEGLARLLPGFAVVSEESGLRGPEVERHVILVDPLDGTQEFIAGRDEFTVNVAILRDRSPAVGLVAAPGRGLFWRGVVGRGAERLRLEPGAPSHEARERLPLHSRRWPRGDAIALVSRSHLESGTRAFLARWPGIAQRACGSSLKFCAIAQGAADIYPRLSPTSEWDIAAGHAILAAAGGAVLTPDGGALVYAQSARHFRVPGFVAWGDPEFALTVR